MRFSVIYANMLSDSFEIQQRAIIDRRKGSSRDVELVKLRRTQAQLSLSWLIYSRSDICVIVTMLAQVTETILEHKHINMLNNAVEYLIESRDFSLHMRKLGLRSLHIHGFSDTSFATVTIIRLSSGTLCCHLTYRAMHARSIMPATRVVESQNPS